MQHQQNYNGAPSSGRDAYYQYDKEKKEKDTQQLYAAGGCCTCIAILMFTIYYLSGRGVIPESYKQEGKIKCQTGNFLCSTICGNLPGHYKEEQYKLACEKGCNEWGREACRRACTSNDLNTCVSSMKNEIIEPFCETYPAEPDPSPHRACLIGAKGVATTEWPCKQGISIIGNILKAHKL